MITVYHSDQNKQIVKAVSSTITHVLGCVVLSVGHRKFTSSRKPKAHSWSQYVSNFLTFMIKLECSLTLRLLKKNVDEISFHLFLSIHQLKIFRWLLLTCDVNYEFTSMKMQCFAKFLSDSVLTEDQHSQFFQPHWLPFLLLIQTQFLCALLFCLVNLL